MHNKYFESYPKYINLLQSHKKIQLMIQKGSINIPRQSPLPIINRNKSVRNNPTNTSLTKSSIRKRTSPNHKQLQQISSKNKRILQSLLGKYHNFSSTIQKSEKDQQERVNQTLSKKIFDYQQILQRASHRLPTSHQEEQYLADSTFNMKLTYQMEKDLQELKQYAHKFNCSLHRKDKYYDCIDDIRKKINSMGMKQTNQEQRDEKKSFVSEPIEKIERNKKIKQIVLPRQINVNMQRLKGKQYLNFSREVGVQSKERYFNERGKIKFVREVVHNWWSNNQQVSMLNSSMS